MTDDSQGSVSSSHPALISAQLGPETLAKLPEPEEFAPGITLQELGQIPNRVGLVRGGIVKLTFKDRLGEERLLGLRAVGWWMNASILLVGVPSFYRVQTLTQCCISFMSLSEFRALLDEPPVLRALLGQQSQYLVAAQYDQSCEHAKSKLSALIH